jgi:hypothetical protein
MSLTTFLQKKFKENCPPGWIAYSEFGLLSPELAQILGYAPRVDVVLENKSSATRYWIEFEISRADPVANHAKFATGHLFAPQAENDIFVSMMSPAIARGRHNLAANTIFLMRRIGMKAFQTLLLPQISPERIKHLNYTQSIDELDSINIFLEIERIFDVTKEIKTMSGHKIFFTANYAEVMLNVRSWNKEIKTEEGKALWGKRRISYFVFDPASKNFAPAKFCAFLPTDPEKIGMSLALYCELDETETRFDGNIAQRHLIQTLGMADCTVGESAELDAHFQAWFERHQDAIGLSPNSILIIPPKWYS